MRRILTIARLTWKAAFRYRLFWVMAALLLISVVGLPMVLKSDGTAQGLTQILLTYTLGAAATLLGFFTLWFACGTLARDVEECQMQVVSVKPIGRWQIWLGKWLGILALNALLLAISGALDFALLRYRAGRLPAAQQKILNQEVFIARAEAREKPWNLQKITEEAVQQGLRSWRRRNPQQQLSADELAQLRTQYAALARAGLEDAPPGYWKWWGVDLSSLSEKARREPLQLRVKFHTSDSNPAATYLTEWVIGNPRLLLHTNIEEVLPPDSFQEFEIPGNRADDKGILVIGLLNPNPATTLSFPLEDGFTILYYENTFAVNFVRGLLVILCWMGLLAALGLAAASTLSFPVAAFASLAFLILCLFSGTLSTVVEENTIFGFDPRAAQYRHTLLDYVVVPFFKGVLALINLVQGFSPIDSLSTGRSVTWGQLGMAVLQIIVLMGGVFAIAGIVLFTRRELAAAQTE